MAATITKAKMLNSSNSKRTVNNVESSSGKQVEKKQSKVTSNSSTNSPSTSNNNRLKYTLGDLVWAKINNNPWWPCKVVYDSDFHYFKVNGNSDIYFVEFIGTVMERSWIADTDLIRYDGIELFKTYAQDQVDQAPTKAAKEKLAERFQLKVSLNKRDMWEKAIKKADLLNKFPNNDLTSSSNKRKVEFTNDSEPQRKKIADKQTKQTNLETSNFKKVNQLEVNSKNQNKTEANGNFVSNKINNEIDGKFVEEEDDEEEEEEDEDEEDDEPLQPTSIYEYDQPNVQDNIDKNDMQQKQSYESNSIMLSNSNTGSDLKSAYSNHSRKMHNLFKVKRENQDESDEMDYEQEDDEEWNGDYFTRNPKNSKKPIASVNVIKPPKTGKKVSNKTAKKSGISNNFDAKLEGSGKKRGRKTNDEKGNERTVISPITIQTQLKQLQQQLEESQRKFKMKKESLATKSLSKVNLKLKTNSLKTTLKIEKADKSDTNLNGYSIKSSNKNNDQNHKTKLNARKTTKIIKTDYLLGSPLSSLESTSASNSEEEEDDPSDLNYIDVEKIKCKKEYARKNSKGTNKKKIANLNKKFHMIQNAKEIDLKLNPCIKNNLSKINDSDINEMIKMAPNDDGSNLNLKSNGNSTPETYLIDRYKYAVRHIQQGLSVEEACNKYRISRGALLKCLNGGTAPRGKKTRLTESEENEIVNWLISDSDLKYNDAIHLVFEKVVHIFKQTKRPNPFNNGRPSMDWFYDFLSRHPQVMASKPDWLMRGKVNQQYIKDVQSGQLKCTKFRRALLSAIQYINSKSEDQPKSSKQSTNNPTTSGLSSTSFSSSKSILAKSNSLKMSVTTNNNNKNVLPNKNSNKSVSLRHSDNSDNSLQSYDFNDKLKIEFNEEDLSSIQPTSLINTTKLSSLSLNIHKSNQQQVFNQNDDFDTDFLNATLDADVTKLNNLIDSTTNNHQMILQQYKTNLDGLEENDFDNLDDDSNFNDTIFLQHKKNYKNDNKSNKDFSIKKEHQSHLLVPDDDDDENESGGSFIKDDVDCQTIDPSTFLS